MIRSYRLPGLSRTRVSVCSVSSNEPWISRLIRSGDASEIRTDCDTESLSLLAAKAFEYRYERRCELSFTDGPVPTAGPDGVTYRFHSFSGRGAITVNADKVHVSATAPSGWWEETIPLADLRPEYGTRSVVTIYVLYALIVLALFVSGAIYQLAHYQFISGVILLVPAAAIGWRMYTRWHRSDWIIFRADGAGCVAYTKQGPDHDKCEEFTDYLTNAIKNSRAAYDREGKGTEPTSKGGLKA